MASIAHAVERIKINPLELLNPQMIERRRQAAGTDEKTRIE